MIDKLTTGVPGLDVLTHGGIPKGRTTLVAGKSGTCKSVLGLQLASHLAREGSYVLHLAIEESPADLITTADALGFDFTGLVASGKLIVKDLTRPFDGPTFVEGEYDIFGLVHQIEAAIRDSKVQVVVLDSATALFSPRPPDELLRTLFYRMVYAFRQLGVTAIVTAEAPGDYGQLTTLGVEDFLCDLVVILRNIVDGERRRRTIEIHKYRRSAHYKGEYPCTITAKGLSVFPLDVREHEALPLAERYPSGFAGLDELNNGGWLRDSIVLLRGPAGSGKTTLAGMYARAGAARGERVVYYGFEETRPILMRNFASLGLPMEDLARSGLLRVTCRYPEATSPEDLLVDLRVGLDEFRPSLIVLDSISSIEHSTSRHGFRTFMVGLAALLREHGRSALLTQTAELTRTDASAPYLSTIPDAIVLVDYEHVDDGKDIDRRIGVLKMRGSAHVTEKRRMVIGPGGLRVERLGSSRTTKKKNGRRVEKRARASRTT